MKKTRRGRDQYALFAPLLKRLSEVLSILPKGVSTFLLSVSRPMPGKIGVLFRYPLIRRLALECGDLVAVWDGTYLHSVDRIKFGSHISIHPMCYIDGSGGITFGDNVSIAHGVTIMSTEHSFDQPSAPIRDAPVMCVPVEIGSDVWIGAGARILAGVSIGDRSVVGAGAVVTKDVPSKSVAAGVPARVIRVID